MFGLHGNSTSETFLGRFGTENHTQKNQLFTENTVDSIFSPYDNSVRDRSAKVTLNVFGSGGRVVRIATTEPQGRQMYNLECLCNCDHICSTFQFTKNKHSPPRDGGNEYCILTYDKIVSCCMYVFEKMRQYGCEYSYIMTKLTVELSLRENHFKLALKEVDIFRGNMRFFGGGKYHNPDLFPNNTMGNLLLNYIKKVN